jgi:hypothetical protein
MYRRKDLFWLTVLELLAPFLLGSSMVKKNFMARESEVNQSHSHHDKQKAEKPIGRDQGQDIPFKVLTLVANFLQSGPISYTSLSVNPSVG